MDPNRSISNNLTILNWNANGIKRQRNLFTQFLHHHNIDVACISETHLVPNESFKIPNYRVHRKDRICEYAAGGVAVIIKNTIKHETVLIPNMVSLEIIGIKIFLSDESQMKIYASYLQPSKRVSLRDISKIFLNETNPIIAAGDFNCKHPAWFSRVSYPNGRTLFGGMITSDWLVCAPEEATYFPTHKDRQPDVLDIMICKNVTNFISQEVITALDSDHVPVLIQLDANCLRCPETLKLITGPVDWEGFQSSLSEKLTIPSNIENIASINEKTFEFTDNLKNSIRENMKKMKKKASL